MGSLHAVVFAAACSVFLAVSASPVPPAVHGAGDGSREWTVPSAPGNGSETPGQWATTHRLHVGDILDFKLWNGSVLLVHCGDYDHCGTASPVLRLADGGGNTTTRFTLDRQDIFYFISGESARCQAGLRVTVNAVARNSTISAPAPAPDVFPAPDESVPSDRPWKMVAYTALGFAAGCICSWLCLFFLVRCGNRE